MRFDPCSFVHTVPYTQDAFPETDALAWAPDKTLYSFLYLEFALFLFKRDPEVFTLQAPQNLGPSQTSPLIQILSIP